jgi:FkbM family methyltransferase
MRCAGGGVGNGADRAPGWSRTEAAILGGRRLAARLIHWRETLLDLRWRAVRALAPRRVVHSRGLRFTLQCENAITHYRWRTYDEKEPETLDWIDRWVRDGDTLFDVGANIGVYTLYAAHRHRGVQVVAFEPEYANLHLLRDNLVENGLAERVTVYAVALGNRCGLSRLHVQDLAPGSALHTEAREPLDRTLAGRPVVWREGICTVTLDEFCKETAIRPNALKIDVDGTEPDVLEGAQETLRWRALRSLLIELPADPAGRDACEGLLRGAGLRRDWRDPLGVSSNEIWTRDSR